MPFLGKLFRNDLRNIEKREILIFITPKIIDDNLTGSDEQHNIFSLVGPMGAGKSTIGKHLADLLDLPFFDVDTEIESRAGADIQWIFDMEGEQGFRDRETKVF